MRFKYSYLFVDIVSNYSGVDEKLLGPNCKIKWYSISDDDLVIATFSIHVCLLLLLHMRFFNHCDIGVCFKNRFSFLQVNGSTVEARPGFSGMAHYLVNGVSITC